MPKDKKINKKFRFPHVLVIMFLLILFSCLLTYIVPAGDFDYTNDGELIPGTYHSIEQSPVNPIYALTLILDGGNQASSIIVLVLFMGGFIGGILQLDSVGKVINYLLQKLVKVSSNVLILGMFLLMGAIGFFVGGDFMIAFVPLGVLLAKKLRLDPITALAITFLPLFLAYSLSPSGMADNGQIIAGIPLYSGYGIRVIIFLIFMAVTSIHITLYTKKVRKNPLKSTMNNQYWIKELDEADEDQLNIDSSQKVTWQDAAVLFILMISPVILAIGNTALGWSEAYGSLNTAIAVFFLGFVLCYLLKRKSMDDMVAAFTKGIQDMVLVAIIIILATTVSVILQEGNILSTIVNLMTNSMSELPVGISSIFIFIISAIFNFIVPSGSGLLGVMIPILQPVAELLGMSTQVLITSLTFGGGLTDLIVPTLGATMGAIVLAKANYLSWLKFMVPLYIIWVIVGFGILYYLASIGWVGY